MKRIDFLKNLGFGSLTMLGSQTFLTACMDMSAKLVPVADGTFTNLLNIPETINGLGNLSAQYGTANFSGSQVAKVLGYHSSLLGPTIRIKKGENINLNFKNNLNEDTNIHWHGLIIPSDMDGHPDQMIMPNAGFNYQFKINQQAGINWYHPHLHEKTGSQVTRGLAGMFIIETTEEQALNLPNGNHEIPLIIQDKRIASDGSIQYKPSMNETMNGYFGESILVNGTAFSYLNVDTAMYRFRVLNGSSARIYNLALSNSDNFYIIGSDGGMLPAPEMVKSLLIAPGERADILIDFSKQKIGDEIFLKNESFSSMGASQGSQEFNIMRFMVSKSASTTFEISKFLIPISPLTQSTKTRTFNLKMGGMMSSGMHKINGKTFKASRIDETVKLGDTEIWEFENSGDEPHPMHMHGVHFQVLSRKNGRNAILPHEKGWKDTVLVGPKEVVQVIMNFTQKGKFVFHCHNLEHEDDGMMLNFEVV
jgi:blue copper oxidase